MAKTLKKIYAGSIELSSLTVRGDRRDTPQQRAAKKQASSDAQRKMNQIYSYQKFELMLAVNFPTAGSGLVVCLTYDDAHLPGSRAQAQRRLAYFLQKLRSPTTISTCPRSAARRSCASGISFKSSAPPGRPQACRRRWWASRRRC